MNENSFLYLLIKKCFFKHFLKCKEVINRFLDKYDNDKLDSLNNDINLVVYNNMNKVIDKYKVSVKQNLDKILTYDDLIKEKNNLKIYYIFKLKLIGKINYSIYIE